MPRHGSVGVPRRGLAVVTGASAGIGRAFAQRLAGRGYDLLLVARDRARLDALRAGLIERHGVAVECFPADLARDDEVTRLIERLRRAPALVLLVNNAGFGTSGLLVDIDPARQSEMLHLHVLAPMRLSQAVLPLFRHERGGAIINVASVAAFAVSAGHVNYCASKTYLLAFSDGLAAEVAGTGVRVQALCPGFTRSEFHARAELDDTAIPRWLWMSTDAVVEASLRQLERGGPVLCVPGFRYRLAVGLLRLLPRPLAVRLARRRARLSSAARR